MPTKEDLLQLAMNEERYLEKSAENYKKYGSDILYYKESYAGDDNYTKYGYELDKLFNEQKPWRNGSYWCQLFINWLFYKTFGKELANKLLCNKLASASTMDVKDAFLAKGRQVSLNAAKPGDIVFRRRTGGGHVGLVIGWKNGLIMTIEGNTTSTDATAWNGGAVAIHVGGKWEWCVRPDWSLIDNKPAEPVPETWKWIYSGGIWYYQNNLGVNKHGWQKIKETKGSLYHWYYFSKTGAMQTGGQKIDGKWYFFMPDNDQNQAGMMCVTDEKGALVVWSSE